MSCGDLYAAVRNAILENNVEALEQLKLSLTRIIVRHRQYRAMKALSTDFSAETYMPLKDRGGNPNNKGRVCTAIRYENITK